jgi:hypothetical protein
MVSGEAFRHRAFPPSERLIMVEHTETSDATDEERLADRVLDAAQRFADARFTALAAVIVDRMKETERTEIYGDVRNFRTLWDEYCYEIQEGPFDNPGREMVGGPSDLMTAMWNPTVDSWIAGDLEAMPNPEVLLLRAVAERQSDEEEPSGPPFTKYDPLCRALRSLIDTQAAERSMAEIEEYGDHWRLTEDDRELVDRLRAAVRSLAVVANSGCDLIAVGEAWQALDAILDAKTVEVNVELTLSFEDGDEASKDGVLFSLRVNEEEVRLDRTDTTWTKEVGSDHSGRVYAVLGREGCFASCEVEEWLEEFAAIKARDDVELSTSRDHT